MIDSTSPIPKKIVDLFRQYYNFESIIDLELYDYDISALKQKLTNVKKNYFEPNDRIIFFNREPGFFVRQRDHVVWYNLQKILSDLDISNKSCIVISQHDSQRYFNKIYQDLSTDDFPVEVFDYWAFTDWMPLPNNDIPLNFDLMHKHYITLNRIRKKHRALVIGYLEHYNILDKGIVSYNSIVSANKEIYHHATTELIKDPNRCHQYLTTIPYTRLNEDWHIRDLKTKKILETITNRGINWVYKNYEEFIDCEIYTNSTGSNSNLLQQAFLWIATESDAYCPVSFLSEKSAKSFYAKRPFVVISGPNTLKRIQSFGFKTFGDFWDESYDREPDVCIRIQKVMKIVNDIAQLSHSDLLTLANSMVDVLEYNYQHLLKFEDYQHFKLKQQILHNLNPTNDQYKKSNC